MDVNELWRQISLATKMRLGIVPKDTAYSAEDREFHALVGRRQSMRKIIIRYNLGSDTYTLRIGRTRRSDFQWVYEGQVEEIGVEKLSEQMETLYVEALHRSAARR